MQSLSSGTSTPLPDLRHLETCSQHVSHQRLVEKVTKRLYRQKHDPAYLAEHRAVRAKIRNLRQVNRQSKVSLDNSSISAIHNASMAMIEAIRGARVRRGSLSQDRLSPFIPRQMSLQPLPKDDPSVSSQQIKCLKMRMGPVLEFNSSHLSQKSLFAKVPQPLPKHSRSKSMNYLVSAEDAQKVKTQLKLDSKKLNVKIKLLVSSLLLLEDEIESCQQQCLKEKRQRLQRKVDTLRTLLDFLRETKSKALQYVTLIDFALSNPHLYIEKLASASDIAAMAKAERAIDVITAQVEVRRRAELTKRELLKYSQVSLSKIVHRIMENEC